MSEADEAAFEAGVASFPLDLSAALRALLLAPHPGLPWTWDAFACVAAAEKAVELHREDMAEAWAWRVADASAHAHLPEGWDSAQSRADALADAVTLRSITHQLAYDDAADTGHVAYLLYCADTKSPRGRASLAYLLRKRPEAARRMCVEAASAAFDAVPELRL